jgi:protein MAK11
LKTRTERGELFQHKGSITALAFYKSSHLLSASADGTLCIWRTHDWLCLHVLGGHKDAVTALAIHPSGRMALSGSKDRTFRLWNLVEGRCAYITKPTFPKSAVIERLEWSPSGSFYAMIAAGTLQIFDATQAGKPTPISSHVQSKRINAGKFISDDEFVIGGDDMVLQVVSVPTGAVLRQIDGDVKARIKDLSLASWTPGCAPILVSVTSVGGVQFWDVAKEGLKCLVASTTAPGSASRLTCVAVSNTTLEEAAPRKGPNAVEQDCATTEPLSSGEPEPKAKKSKKHRANK